MKHNGLHCIPFAHSIRTVVAAGPLPLLQTYFVNNVKFRRAQARTLQKHAREASTPPARERVTMGLPDKICELERRRIN